MSQLFRLTSSTLLAAGLLVATAASQEIPPDDVLQGFEPASELAVEVSGRLSAEADVYRSQKAGSAILVKAPELPSPILVSPRARTVQAVPLAKVVERPAGSLDILADADLDDLGSFTIEGTDVAFSVGKTPVRLVEKPFLLGRQDTGAMLAYGEEYPYRARQYQPSAPMLRRLKGLDKPVTVTVYFGSWCPHCREMVPRLLRVAEELEGSKISFQYYGLPRSWSGEPEAERAGISAVPTGVVKVGGKEVGRLESGDWRVPELALVKLLGA